MFRNQQIQFGGDLEKEAVRITKKCGNLENKSCLAPRFLFSQFSQFPASHRVIIIACGVLSQKRGCSFTPRGHEMLKNWKYDPITCLLEQLGTSRNDYFVCWARLPFLTNSTLRQVHFRGLMTQITFKKKSLTMAARNAINVKRTETGRKGEIDKQNKIWTEFFFGRIIERIVCVDGD